MLESQQLKHDFTVTEISLSLKNTLEKNFSNIRVKGEISGLKIASSGHCYFSLKDEKSVLNATCWRHVASKLKIKLEEGMEIVCSGSISTFPNRSLYQLNVENIEISGIGALLKLLAQRKEKLAKEGLFSPERKKKIPLLPQTIAVITSPTGAVIQDIIHRIEERFPVHIMVWGVNVQGTESAQQVSDAIYGLQNLPPNLPKPDLIIVARGGGSIEDLWPFNEEIVVRAVAASTIPLISAVGHETDTTLIDFASDKRAPTPTAAAEIAVPRKSDLAHLNYNYYNRLLSSLKNKYRQASHLLTQLTLKMTNLEKNFQHQQIFIESTSHRLQQAINKYIALRNDYFIKKSSKLSSSNISNNHEIKQYNLKHQTQKLQELLRYIINNNSNILHFTGSLLDSYNPSSILKRGFAVIKDNKNHPLDSAKKLTLGSAISITMHDGLANAIISNSTKKISQKNKVIHQPTLQF